MNRNVEKLPKIPHHAMLQWNSRQKQTKALFVIEEKIRFTIVSFLSKLIFNGVQGHFYASIKIAILNTKKDRHNMKLCS